MLCHTTCVLVTSQNGLAEQHVVPFNPMSRSLVRFNEHRENSLCLPVMKILLFFRLNFREIQMKQAIANYQKFQK